MNMYLISSQLTALMNLILGLSFIFYIDEIKNNNLMLQYFLLYLLTMFIALILFHLSNKYEFQKRYPSTKK